MRIRLRYPASPENARDHAQIAVKLAREEYDADFDFSPVSLELVIPVELTSFTAE